MDLHSFNCGDLYKSNYGDPSIELCITQIYNRIMEIHNWKNGSPYWIMAIQNWIMEIYNELRSSIMSYETP